MKKTIKLFGNLNRARSTKVPLLIIALVAVIGFTMAACSDGSDSTPVTPTTYMVIVNGGIGSGIYAPGVPVSISATVPSGQTFTNWTVNSGGATLANPNSASTTFIMPANAVTVTANFTGSSNTLSLNGVWTAMGGGLVTTISGSSGTLTSIGVSSALWQDAVSKGYVKVGSQYFRNLTSTGTLTWSGQVLGVQYYTPNVAAGTSWLNCTITMSSNGQTFTDGTNTYTRQ